MRTRRKFWPCCGPALGAGWLVEDFTERRDIGKKFAPGSQRAGDALASTIAEGRGWLWVGGDADSRSKLVEEQPGDESLAGRVNVAARRCCCESCGGRGVESGNAGIRRRPRNDEARRFSKVAALSDRVGSGYVLAAVLGSLRQIRRGATGAAFRPRTRGDRARNALATTQPQRAGNCGRRDAQEAPRVEILLTHIPVGRLNTVTGRQYPSFVRQGPEEGESQRSPVYGMTHTLRARKASSAEDDLGE